MAKRTNSYRYRTAKSRWESRQERITAPKPYNNTSGRRGTSVTNIRQDWEQVRWTENYNKGPSQTFIVNNPGDRSFIASQVTKGSSDYNPRMAKGTGGALEPAASTYPTKFTGSGTVGGTTRRKKPRKN